MLYPPRTVRYSIQQSKSAKKPTTREHCTLYGRLCGQAKPLDLPFPLLCVSFLSEPTVRPYCIYQEKRGGTGEHVNNSDYHSSENAPFGHVPPVFSRAPCGQDAFSLGFRVQSNGSNVSQACILVCSLFSISSPSGHFGRSAFHHGALHSQYIPLCTCSCPSFALLALCWLCRVCPSACLFGYFGLANGCVLSLCYIRLQDRVHA